MSRSSRREIRDYNIGLEEKKIRQCEYDINLTKTWQKHEPLDSKARRFIAGREREKKTAEKNIRILRRSR